MRMQNSANLSILEIRNFPDRSYYEIITTKASFIHARMTKYLYLAILE